MIRTLARSVLETSAYTLLAALAMLIWGVAFWNSPLPYRALRQLKDEDATTQMLRTEFPESGAYMIPSPETDPEIRAEALRFGPVATVFVRYGPPSLHWIGIWGSGLSLNFVTAFLIGCAMKWVRPALGVYRRRLGFVLLTGLAASLLPNLSDPIWWSHPLTWHLISALFTLISWLAGGTILALFIRQEPVPGATVPPPTGPAG